MTAEIAEGAAGGSAGKAAGKAASGGGLAKAAGKLNGPTIKTPIGNTPIIPLIGIMVGGYLMWFGVHYWRGDLKWPSDPIKSVLQGKGLPAQGTVTTSEAILTAVETTAGNAAKKTQPGSTHIPVPAGAHGNAAKNQNIAKMLCAGYGWAPQQNRADWNALVDLWNGESGWNEFAENKSSGAYGIPQSLPGDKMASAGADWRTNPRTQIKWGLKYIKDTYGSPSAAYAAWLSRNPHWY